MHTNLSSACIRISEATNWQHHYTSRAKFTIIRSIKAPCKWQFFMYSPKLYVLSFGLCFHDFLLLIRMAKKRNTTPGGLDYARQSIVESTETRSLDASPSDDLDNMYTQELPNVESKESPRMIDISNNTEIATLVEEPEISPGDEVGEENHALAEPIDDRGEISSFESRLIESPVFRKHTSY